jgi:hypothetical protein
MTTMTLCQIVSLELRCSSEAASARFDRLVNEGGHIWSYGDEKRRVCGVLRHFVDENDTDARMSLSPDTIDDVLADEIVESVVPKVIGKLERL